MRRNKLVLCICAFVVLLSIVSCGNKTGDAAKQASSDVETGTDKETSEPASVVAAEAAVPVAAESSVSMESSMESREAADAELEYEGLILKYNGVEYNLEKYDDMVGAIMDAWQVGDWVVVEGHISPHVGTYFLLNKHTGEIEKTIYGANLTWQGDDITTAVYSAFNEVYNYKGHPIGTIDGDEVYELSFTDGGSTVTAVDFDDVSYEFDAPAYDAGLYRYADYLRNPTDSTWKAFIYEAPEGAVGLIIENPDEDILKLLPLPVKQSAGTEETLFVVALSDGTEVKLESGNLNPGASGDEFTWKPIETLDSVTLDKGESRGYYLVIPEGIPATSVLISADGRSGRFNVSPVSGENDLCAAFVSVDK